MNPSATLHVLEQVIWCYGNISGESVQHRDMILADGVVGKIAEVLDLTGTDTNAMRNIAWCLANLMKGEVLPPVQMTL